MWLDTRLSGHVETPKTPITVLTKYRNQAFILWIEWS